jgi:hypothetical protein
MVSYHGYGWVKYQGRQMNAHRLVYFLVHGQWPVVARHACNNRLCCNPAHIIDGSHRDNAQDRSRALAESGERNGRAKLRDADVPAIRARIAAGETNITIAKEYGVSDVVISTIRRGTRWKHVP